MPESTTVDANDRRVGGLTRSQLLDLLRVMLRIRRFEEKVEELHSQGLIYGTMHLYIGQEAIAAGVMAARKAEDPFTSTHRGHGHCIAGGAELWRMFAELLGKDEGYCRGRGGSMHIANLESGNLGANGIVAGSVGIAVGSALAQKMSNRDSVVFCFIGDGAVNQGVFHEAVNMAAIWALPVVFVCENNFYAMSFHYRRSMRHEQISQRVGLGYGFPAQSVDGNDVLAVLEAAAAARTHAASQGPVFLECVSYRWRGHSKSDANLYRTKEEIEGWKNRCPILRLQRRLITDQLLTEEEFDVMESDVRREVEDAVRMAQSGRDAPPIQVPDEVYV